MNYRALYSLYRTSNCKHSFFNCNHSVQLQALSKCTKVEVLTQLSKITKIDMKYFDEAYFESLLRITVEGVSCQTLAQLTT